MALLLSMPGTPVIYYGDEIGMGDNIHLGDRDGVRTPMQWSPDRNGGFSRANPADLMLPPVMDPLYGYAAVNVEAQASDAHSVLNWMRRMLAVRKRHRAFGRGALQFLYPGNRKVLSYLRHGTSADGNAETILCVYNVGRTAQAVELDLSAFTGRVPVDLLGGSAFPPIGQLTYLLTLPPYGFYWFILATEAALPHWHIRPSEPLPELSTLVVHDGLNDVLLPAARKIIETDALPPYLARRRWFASKNQKMISARLVRTDKIPGQAMDIILAEVEVQLANRTEHYQLPLGIAWNDGNVSALTQQLALAQVRQSHRMGYLTDAFSLDAFPLGVIRSMRGRVVRHISEGEVRCTATSHFDAIELPKNPEIRRLSAEQSNSSLIVGDLVVIKLIRRVMHGINPEVEMVRYLTEQGYTNTPPLLGEITRVTANGDSHTMIVAQRFVHNQGDAWQWTLNYLNRYSETIGVSGKTNDDETDALVNYAAFARAMGTRLGQLHEVLARPSADDAFNPMIAEASDAQAWAAAAAAQINQMVETLSQVKSWPDEATQDAADFVLINYQKILSMLPELAQAGTGSLQTRIHGDFHLGQVLFATGDAHIIDFEGEPSKPLAARRAKSSPLRDAAGLLRSFQYAAAAVRLSYTAAPAQAHPQEEAIYQRFVDDMSAHFLTSYFEVEVNSPRRWIASEAEATNMLDLFLLEKSAYEICYEAANRPTWIGIPLRGFAQITARLLQQTQELEHA